MRILEHRHMVLDTSGGHNLQVHQGYCSLDVHVMETDVLRRQRARYVTAPKPDVRHDVRLERSLQLLDPTTLSGGMADAVDDLYKTTVAVAGGTGHADSEARLHP